MRYAPTLQENLKSKNKNESSTRLGAYCIRPTNILSRTILCYTNTRLRQLRLRLDGVFDTPLQSWYTDILRIKMYPGRGVSHTPSERFLRKRRDTSIHKNDLSPPPAAFGGRMQYTPTLPENREQKTKNKKGISIMSEFQKLSFSLVWYSFLALMQEKNQKKIKASGTPAKF